MPSLGDSSAAPSAGGPRFRWQAQEAFDAFGATLLPILATAGVEMNPPMVARVHNQIKG
jgi:hypothetical protein